MITTDSSFLIIAYGNYVHLFNEDGPGWEIKNSFGYELFKQDSVLFSQDWNTLHRSMDGGQTWEQLPLYCSPFRTTNTTIFSSCE